MANIRYVNNIISMLQSSPPRRSGADRPASPAKLRLVPKALPETEFSLRRRTDTVGTIRRALEIKVRNELI